jgi:hypothetical protein
MTLQQLKQLSASCGLEEYPPQRIPTLAEVAALLLKMWLWRWSSKPTASWSRKSAGVLPLSWRSGFASARWCCPSPPPACVLSAGCPGYPGRFHYLDPKMAQKDFVLLGPAWNLLLKNPLYVTLRIGAGNCCSVGSRFDHAYNWYRWLKVDAVLADDPAAAASALRRSHFFKKLILNTGRISRMKQQIIAMGGGGFSMEPDNLAWTSTSLSRPTSLTRCVLPADRQRDSRNTSSSFMPPSPTRCQPTIFPCSDCRQQTCEVLAFPGCDLCPVGQYPQHVVPVAAGLHRILRKALENGIVLAGSVPAICWFEQGITDSVPGELSVMPALGFLPGSCCPHYNSEENRRPAYHNAVLSGTARPAWRSMTARRLTLSTEN